jgi:hypothetical protein
MVPKGYGLERVGRKAGAEGYGPKGRSQRVDPEGKGQRVAAGKQGQGHAPDDRGKNKAATTGSVAAILLSGVKRSFRLNRFSSDVRIQTGFQDLNGFGFFQDRWMLVFQDCSDFGFFRIVGLWFFRTFRMLVSQDR